MSDIDLVDIKSLLHFDNLLKDEINIETWSKEKTSVTSGDITKFGHGSLYSNKGALLGTNTSGMWSLNSNGSYEIEFFVYPVAHGGTRKLFRLMEQDNSSPIFMLSLTKAGYLEFTATGWDITNALIGTTILAITTWHHVLIRVSNQTITIFLDAVEEVSSDLPDNIILNVQQVMLGYFSTSSFNYYIDEFIFRHSAENGTPSIPTSPCVITSSSEPVFKNTKSLLHFDELCKDEIGLESWTKENTNVMLFDFAKFGYGSLYSNKGALLGTNTSGIWSLKSNGNYEIEFFVYPVAYGGTRYFFRLMSGSTTLLNLSLNTNGTVNFACSTFGCSGLNGSTVLTIQEWYHIMLRISNKTAKVFINGIEDITTDLLENKGLAPTQARVGYFDTSRGSFCMDEFLFRHSAGTGTPIIPTSPYTFCAYQFHQKRKFPLSIKSLFHFDYPYFNEPNDGLEDEIGLENWTKYGNIALYGSEIPNTGTLAPKFGYRCLCTYNGYIYCDSWNRSGIWNINSSGRYEIEFFVQFDNVANTQNIFTLIGVGDDGEYESLKLSLLTSGNLAFEASDFGADSISSTTVLTSLVWYHVFMRISGNSMHVYLDGKLEISISLTPDVTLSTDHVRIGNNISNNSVYIDEFVFRHSANKGNPTVPTEPYNGYLDKEIVGSYGTGSDGDVIISANTQINSYGIINSITDTRTFTVASWNYGIAIPEIGSEVMIHITAPCFTASSGYPLAGLYSFAKIAAIHDTSVVLDRDITIENGDDFTLISEFLDIYYIQVITVPNYHSFTINYGCTVSPLLWNNTNGGGIVAFRCLSNCTIDGSIITLGKGAVRYDWHQMTHSKIVDRFLCSRGGGIFITCGGTFTATNTARLGAIWYGLGDGQNGTSGYGGKGTSVKYGNNIASGGAGGVGGGGGGASMYASYGASGGAAGKNGVGATHVCSGGGGCRGKGGSITNSGVQGALCAGSGGGGQGNSGGAGGTITHAAGNPYRTSANSNIGGNAGTINGGAYKTISTGAIPSGAGGGAPGGDSGAGSVGAKGSAGASIILICNKLKADINALSTGGVGGSTSTSANTGSGGAGGGGTGFCYIAAGELLDK